MARARRNAQVLALLLFLSLTRHGQAEGAQIFGNPSNWDPPDRVSASAADLFSVEPYAGDWQSRSFFLVGRLDNGTFFVINPFFWHFSLFQSWGLTVLITDTRGRLYSFNSGLPLSHIEMTSQGLDLQLDTAVFAMSGSKTHVHIALDGFSCDLRITNILPPWRPGDGLAWYDAGRKAYSRYAIAAPWALVSGSMTVFGESMNADGQCFLDTSYAVQPLDRPNSPLYAFRAFSDPGLPMKDRVFIDMLESFTDARYGALPLSMLLVARGDSWVFTARDFSLMPADWASSEDPPYPYPLSCRVSAEKSGYRLEGEFAAARLYHTTDVFRGIPQFMRTLVSLFVKRPVLYRMIGSFKGSLVSPDGSVQRLDMPAHGEYVVVK
jgi:hypothetical protein